MNEREREIYKVTLIGSVVNAILIVLKFIAGFVGKSSAMVADAVHSLSDFLSDIIVIIFVKIAGKPTDKSHDYGHGKFETFATLIIGVLLIIAGVGLSAEGIKHVVDYFHGEMLPKPTFLALIVAIVSIVLKEILYRYTLHKGKKLNSKAVEANALHHRSDAFSSIGTLVGVAGAMFFGEKLRILDPLAAITVSLFIIKSGGDIAKPCLDELLEASLPEQTEQKILEIVKSADGILDVHRLRTRRIGNDIAIDLHAKMDGSQTLSEAHDKVSIAEQLLKKEFGPGTIVNIHEEPWKGVPEEKGE